MQTAAKETKAKTNTNGLEVVKPVSPKEKVLTIVKALVASASVLHKQPIVTNEKAGIAIRRLPLTSYLNGGGVYFLVIQELVNTYGVNCRDIAKALRVIARQALAAIDINGIDAHEVGATTEVLSEVLTKRGMGGAGNAPLETDCRIYVRDLLEPKPSNKTGRKGVTVAQWFGVPSFDKFAGLPDDVGDKMDEDKVLAVGDTNEA